MVAALGVTINVSRLEHGLVTVDNTASRKREIMAAIQQAIDDRKVSRIAALRLRGRLQFVSGQIFGRISKRCLAVITKHA